MAKTIIERIESALKSGSRAKTIEDLIPIVETKIKELGIAAQLEFEISSDLVESLEGRQAAVRRQDILDRDVIAYGNHLQDLRETLVKRTESDAAKSKAAFFAKAKSETTELANKLADIWPKMQAQALALITELELNQQLVELANSQRPGDQEPLKNAETIAREIPSNFAVNGTPVARLSSIKFPEFKGGGYVDRHAVRQAPKLQKAVVQPYKAPEWQHVKVSNPKNKQGVTFYTKTGASSAGIEPRPFVMQASSIKMAQQAGLTVEAI